MNVETAVGRPPLVLLVDPVVASRHWMWRGLSRAFGVLEAGSAGGARDWIARRPDIDALVVQDELPDGRGLELVEELASEHHPVVSRSIVLARPGSRWSTQRARRGDAHRAGRPSRGRVEARDLVSRARRLAGARPPARRGPQQALIAFGPRSLFSGATSGRRGRGPRRAQLRTRLLRGPLPVTGPVRQLPAPSRAGSTYRRRPGSPRPEHRVRRRPRAARRRGWAPCGWTGTSASAGASPSDRTRGVSGTAGW